MGVFASPIFGNEDGPAFGDGVRVFHPETVALLSRFSTPATDAWAAAYNDVLVAPLKVEGIFAKLDYLHVWDANDAQSSDQNVIQNAHNATRNGTLTHTPKQGIVSNGSTGYVNENFNPGDGGSHLYTQNSAMIGFWSRTNNSGAVMDIGARVGANIQNTTLNARNGSNAAAYRINESTTGFSIANADATGMYILERTGAAAAALYRDGTLLRTSTGASAALPNLSFYLCAMNDNGNAAVFSTRQYSASFGGAPLSSGEKASFRTILNNWHTAVGGL